MFSLTVIKYGLNPRQEYVHEESFYAHFSIIFGKFFIRKGIP